MVAMRWIRAVTIVGLSMSGPAAQAPPGSRAVEGSAPVRAEPVATASAASWARSASVQRAVDRGLAWLAREQNPRGFWTGLIGARRGRYVKLRELDEQILAGTGHLGVTAICGMAFLAGGHLPGRGRYGEVVSRTNAAVLSCIHENGLIGWGGTRMYSHAFATLYLAEVCGMDPDPRIREGLARATQMIVDCQNRYGGWRYNAFQTSADLSVTVCQLQALRAARNIGIRIPRSTIDRAIAFVKASQVPSGEHKGRYYYAVHDHRRYRKTDHYAIQAAAVTSLVSAGIYDRDLIEPVLDFLTEQTPHVAYEYGHDYHFWYGHYYASQAFFHADGLVRYGCFRQYYEQVRDHLLADQEADGRWLNPQSNGPGDAFATAVACIVLQIPMQYLPIFQR